MHVGRTLTLGAALVCAVLHLAAAAPLNIVAIGASNTAGWGVGADNAYPAVLQMMLRERGYDAHVSNAGVSFSTTNGMLQRLDFVVKPGTSILILQPGGNDTRFFGSKDQRIKNIAAITERMRARHIRVIVFENADVVPAGQYQWDGIHFTRQGHVTAATYLLHQVIGAKADKHEPAQSAPAPAPPTNVSQIPRT
jgi:acyl-CoA thioesterase I